MHLDLIPVLEVTWDPARLSLKVSTFHRLKFDFFKNPLDQLELALIKPRRVLMREEMYKFDVSLQPAANSVSVDG